MMHEISQLQKQLSSRSRGATASQEASAVAALWRDKTAWQARLREIQLPPMVAAATSGATRRLGKEGGSKK